METFQTITTQDIALLNRYFAMRGTRLCNDSAGAAVLWQPYFQDAYLILDDTLLLREEFPGIGTVYAPPVGANVEHAYAFLEQTCRESGQPLCFFPVTEPELAALRARYTHVETTLLRDWCDYLYDAQDMVQFRGRRYNGQRNHIHRFQRLYPDWRFEDVTADNLPELRAFFETFAARYRKENETAQVEEQCVRDFLAHYFDYAPLGGLLRAGGKIVGFSAGEIVGDTLIIHVEKADVAYDGVYQVLVNEFAKRFVTESVQYINREEDVGDPGVRKSKESYHPLRLLEKYLVEVTLGTHTEKGRL